MAITLNIGLNNTAHMSQKSAVNAALHLIGNALVRDWKVYDVEHPHDPAGSEDTLVIDLYADVTPSQVYRVAEVLAQDCIAYLNDSGEQDIGLLIGPRASEWGPFKHEYFRLIDGTAPEPEREDVPATMGERLMPGCRCGAASRGDFERCRCD